MPVIERDFGELYLRVAGEGGEAIIFLHEYFGTHESWAAQRADFARSFQVLTPDLRGHGRSPVRAGDRISITGIAADVRAVQERFSLGACHLVGCSLGAVVAMHLAINHPQAVRSLTVASVPSFASPAATAYGREYIERIFPRVESTLDRFHGSGEAGYARNVLLSNFAQDLHEMPEDHAGTTRNLERVSAPVLVIGGEHDPVFPPRSAIDMAERMPRSSLAVLPASAHLVHQELPGVFNSLVVDHLLRSSRERGAVSA